MIVLRDYQIDVINRSRRRVAEGARRVMIQGSTGCGKTHIASEIIRLAVQKGSRALFLVHRRRLVQQIADRLQAFGVPHGVIMAGIEPIPTAPVQVASRDTLLSRCVRNEWTGFPPAELVLLDEAHNMRLTGAQNESEMSGYESIFRIYPKATVIGLSATPARSSGHGLGNYFQALECTAPTSQLIREGWLVPVRCYAPERMGKARRKGHKVSGLAGDPVTWWRKLAIDRPTVVFAGRVKESQAVVAKFREAGIPAIHMDAHTPDDERDKGIRDIEEGRVKVVSNVGIHTEGTDIPCLSCCILLRSCSSYVLYAQCVGRIMRSHPGKTDAVLIDHAAACYTHGLPDEDVEWTLDVTDTVDHRNKEAKLAGKRKTTLTCPRCAFIFAGTIQCPACGHRLAQKHVPPRVRDELLVEVGRDITPLRERENNVRAWKAVLGQCYHMGRSYKLARIMYMRKTGQWPAEDFPHQYDRSEWDQPVRELIPDYTQRKAVV